MNEEKARGDGGLWNHRPSVSYQNQISKRRRGGGDSRVGNINQSVHLVGNHMADQHANCANLLIFSNRVQLIPLAAFISPSHSGGNRVKKKKRRVCYDFLPIFFKSVLRSLSFFRQWRQLRWWMRWTRGPQVAAVVVGGGWQRGRWGKSGGIRKPRGGDSGGDGINLD